MTRSCCPATWEELSYDEAGRVTEVKHFDGTTEQLRVRSRRALIRAANDETEVVFERDALGRVLSERMGEVVVTSRYGPDGARGVVESSLGARQAVLYDALGEVESLHHGPVSDFWRTEQRFGRDSLGAELSRELPGGLQVSWNRDASGKPTARPHATQPARRPPRRAERPGLPVARRGPDRGHRRSRRRSAMV